MSTPVLHLLAGSDGAGKSTLAQEILIPRTHLPFVNSDLIAERLWPGDRGEQARRAAEVSQLAAEERARLMAQQVSFITETVFSHPSKLDLLRQAQLSGYTVSLHIVMVPEDLAVERVADRVTYGGHRVPEDKIRGRYGRLWELVAQARHMADRANFYDNSSLDEPFSTCRDLRVRTAGWSAELAGLGPSPLTRRQVVTDPHTQSASHSPRAPTVSSRFRCPVIDGAKDRAHHSVGVRTADRLGPGR